MTLNSRELEVYALVMDSYGDRLDVLAAQNETSRQTAEPLQRVLCLPTQDKDITVEEARTTMCLPPFGEGGLLDDTPVCTDGRTKLAILAVAQKVDVRIRRALNPKSARKGELVSNESIALIGFAAALGCALLGRVNQVGRGQGVAANAHPAYKLGFLQGLLYAAGIYSISELISHLYEPAETI